MSGKIPVSVLIMTQNEEANIPFAVESVLPYFNQVIVADSFSTDTTLEILGRYPEVQVYSHVFESWAAQRNWMLSNCGIRNEVVFFLDADEYVRPEFVEELRDILAAKTPFSAIYLDRDYVFLGKNLKHSHGHPVTLRIFKRTGLSFVGEGAREYAKISGPAIAMRSRYIHHDRNPLSVWFRKHNNNSDREAALFLNRAQYGLNLATENISLAQRIKLWVRENIWNRIPLLVRPFIYFPARYIATGSFLEGVPAFAYTYLHAFVYQSLIDAKILHAKTSVDNTVAVEDPPTAAPELPKLPVSVLIMTQNEEENVEHALKSVVPYFDQIIVTDSFSTDKTLDLVREYPQVAIFQHAFENWAEQRNWMLANCGVKNEVVLFLDADEHITPEFVAELRGILEAGQDFSSIFVRPNLIFMGRPLGYAYGHPKIRRIFKKGVRFFGLGAREYAISDGAAIELKTPLMHHDRKPLSAWVAKHNNNSDREAVCFIERQAKDEKVRNANLPDSLKQTLWIRRNIWNRLPLLLRPAGYFFYRYIVKLGFLDGLAGFVYCFLHSMIYQSMIDVKIMEKRNAQSL